MDDLFFPFLIYFWKYLFQTIKSSERYDICERTRDIESQLNKIVNEFLEIETIGQ